MKNRAITSRSSNPNIYYKKKEDKIESVQPSSPTQRTPVDYDMGTKTLKVKRVNKAPRGARQSGRGRTYKSFK